ncbi:MAG: PSD1 domain-containing protein [Bryobacterales bacterium]|nr:PSD1 domain-containing protein [Bryobacterales bacterium]
MRPALALLLWTSSLAADVTFVGDVRPILESRCVACHRGSGAAAGVALDAFDSVRSLVHAGDAESSRLWLQVSGTPPAMPKGGRPLDASQLTVLRDWILQGAPEGSGPPAPAVWWAFRPLQRFEPPPAAGWGRTPVDSFIHAKQRAQALEPAPEADRRTLIRRVTYNLHGLPPSPEDIEAFVNDRDPEAYEKLVDRLLASPRYGERWGRHWLDVVHYGESHGYDKDKPRRNAWPYRDYVIRSFNEDKPYARFVEEQLAGDVLYPDDPRAVVATGFVAAGPWDFVGHVELREGTVDKRITRSLDRDDMVMAAMSTFTSMTVHCARCHDHKFDPIPQADYYKLQAVFGGVDRADRPYDEDPAVWGKRRPLLQARRTVLAGLQPLYDQAARLDNEETRAIDGAVAALRKEISGIPPAGAGSDPARRSALQAKVAAAQKERQEITFGLLPEPRRSQFQALRGELTRLDAALGALPKPAWVYAASNDFARQSNFSPAWSPRPVHLLARGSVEAEGSLMTPGALSAVAGLPADFGAIDAEGERRAALARWVTDSKNPLTWRSIANRVWHFHFGAGLVDSPNDFGRMGAEPSHPELLDWLAQFLLDNDGSLKKLHRLILTSAVYRQSSRHHDAFAKIDGENRSLWRMNRTRLEAEAVRDSVLAVTGKLDLTVGGPPAEHFFFRDDHSPEYDYARFDPDGPGAHRRAIYRFIVRSVPDPFFESLDCPDASQLTAKRNVTLTAIQALALLNDPFMVRQSEHFAARLERERPDLPSRVERAYELALGRAPRPEESRALIEYGRAHGLVNACRLLFNLNEFVFVD